MKHAPTTGARDVLEVTRTGTGLDVPLQRFFDLSDDLLCVARFDGRFEQLSASWSDLLGYTRDELLAVPFLDLVHPEDRDGTVEQLVTQIATGARGVAFDNRCRAKDGSYRHLRWHATPDAAHQLVYAVARCLDDELAADLAIRTSEAIFRSAFDDALIGMCLTSPDGRFTRVNTVLAKMLGRPPEEVLGMRFSDVTHPDDRERGLTAFQGMLAGSSAGYHDEKRYVRPDGTVVDASLSTTLVRDARGEPQHFVTQLLDVTEQKAAERRRGAVASMLDAIVQNSQSLIYVKDLEGRYLLANGPFLQAFAVTEDELLGRDDTWLDPALAPVWRVNDERARDGAHRVLEWSDGVHGRQWYESVKFPLYDAAGALYATCGVSLDTTELHEQREEARRSGAFSAAVLAASPDAIQVVDVASTRAVFSSRSTAASPADGRSALLTEAVHPADHAKLAATLVAAGDLEDGQVLQVRYRSHPDQGSRWLSSRVTPFRREADGRLVEVLTVVRDVTEAVAAEERLSHAALHDPLTGLPNRTLLSDRLTGALARAERHGEQLAVLFVDLDGFKRVNDAAGHAAGDAVLLTTAQRLRRVLREHDTVARVGGDEFVVLLEGGSARAGGDGAPDPGAARGTDVRSRAVQVAERIVMTLSAPVPVEGSAYAVSASVGVAFAGAADMADPALPRPLAEDVLRDADAAMYRAKSRGKDRFELFETSLLTDMRQRGRTERALRAALSGELPAAHADQPTRATFDLAYQPLYDGDSGRLLGFEALARLWDETGAAVAPDAFIPVAEETGLIRVLGDLALHRACARLAEWRRTHPDADELTMAVNLSPRQAEHPDLVVDAMTALAAAGLPPDKLVLELTETVLLEASSATIAAFRQLREAGIGIAIDDFGTGYGSLRYLADLPVSTVKVDRSFTAGLPEDGRSATIVRAVAGLARDLSLQCVVEGVENDEQRAALPAGVVLQGFLLGQPSLVADIDLPQLALARV